MTGLGAVFDTARSEAIDDASAQFPSPREQETDRLDLLVPDALPTHFVPNPADRAVLQHTLCGIVKALQHHDRREGLHMLGALLSQIDVPGSMPAAVGQTGTPAKTAQVNDFDRYFRVNRIVSPDPALTLVRGLLQTATAVFDLFCRAKDLPAAEIERQTAGFLAYAHLLGRIFDRMEIQ